MPKTSNNSWNGSNLSQYKLHHSRLVQNQGDGVTYPGTFSETGQFDVRIFIKPSTSLTQVRRHFFYLAQQPPSPPPWVRASSFMRFLDHTQRRTTVGRTPLEEWPARRRDLYLTTQHSQQTNIHALGGIRNHNLSWRAATDIRLRPRGHWDRQPDVMQEGN